jgi:hypothetical protein
MLKGQIKSEIGDIQKEFNKIGGYTIERTLAFDKNTDIRLIQIEDRFHTCVIGTELHPPKGSECEKGLIKIWIKPIHLQQDTELEKNIISKNYRKFSISLLKNKISKKN